MSKPPGRRLSSLSNRTCASGDPVLRRAEIAPWRHADDRCALRAAARAQQLEAADDEAIARRDGCEHREEYDEENSHPAADRQQFRGLLEHVAVRHPCVIR